MYLYCFCEDGSFFENKYKDNRHNTSAFFFLFNFQITRLLVNYVYYYLFLVLFTMQKQNRFPFLGRNVLNHCYITEYFAFLPIQRKRYF